MFYNRAEGKIHYVRDIPPGNLILYIIVLQV